MVSIQTTGKIKIWKHYIWEKFISPFCWKWKLQSILFTHFFSKSKMALLNFSIVKKYCCSQKLSWMTDETRLFICNALVGFRVNHALHTSVTKFWYAHKHCGDHIKFLQKFHLYLSISMNATQALQMTKFL